MSAINTEGTSVWSTVFGFCVGTKVDTAKGSAWALANTCLSNGAVNWPAGANIAAGTTGGVFISLNEGASWNATDLKTTAVHALSTVGKNLFAGTSGAYRPEFNALGQRVAVLQDGDQLAGMHDAVFDAAGLPSGVYVYRLQAGEFARAKKKMLVW